MRRLPVLLTTLLVATLVAVVGASHGEAAGTKRKPVKKPTSISLRLAPARVTVYASGVQEPTGLVAQVSPAQSGRVVTFQRYGDGGWRAVARVRTDATGRAWRPVAVTAPGSWVYRATVTGTTWRKPAVSGERGLRATADTECRTRYGSPVDADATGEAHCLLARLDSWRDSGAMAVGQQVNISRHDDWDVPLRGIAPAVVGFDLEELDRAATAQYPYVDENVQGLLDRARAGAVLVASWHATNPFTGEGYDSAPRPIAELLDEDSAVAQEFWADWDAKLALLKRFQDGDSDGDGDDGSDDGERTAVVVRPFHEVNGGFFWWGRPSAATYRALWTELQRRTAAAGVHNVVWAYSGNRKTSSTSDPGAYVPTRVDLAGLDAYDPERGAGNAVDVQPLEGYAAIATKVRRMALTEVGPHGSADGSWNPAVISTAVRKARITPLWAMLWFDDTGYADAGRKQITSLRGGRAWLRSCFNSLCATR